MKKLTLYFSFILLITSCSKDDKESQRSSAASLAVGDVILGDWNLHSVSIQNGHRTVNGLQDQTYHGKSREVSGDVIFNPDSTMSCNIMYVMDMKIHLGNTGPFDGEWTISMGGGGFEYEVKSDDLLHMNGLLGSWKDYRASGVSINQMTLLTHVVDVDTFQTDIVKEEHDISFTLVRK